MIEPGCRAGSRRDGIVLAALALLLGAGVLGYSQTIAFAWNEGFHLLAAQQINAGKKPYIDFCFPQTPLNAYVTAAGMRLAGDDWRTAHAISSLFTTGAILLVAGYVYSRLPASGWRLPAAAVSALLTGLNDLVFQYGSIGQAYGLCIFALTASFCVSVAAVERKGPIAAGVAGVFAGVAVASSLLTAMGAAVLLPWIVLQNRVGGRWKKAAGFLLGAVVPCLPALWLFAEGPRQTLFNLFEYHLLYRAPNWHNVAGQDLLILTSWVNCGQAVLLVLLAAGGLVCLRPDGDDPGAGVRRAEFKLCAWLALLLGAEAATAHPTYKPYFVLMVPFLAILAGYGFHQIGMRMTLRGRPVWAAAGVASLVLLSWGRGVYDRWESFYSWTDIERLARITPEAAPPGGELWADEHIYFLTRRAPPSGMEFAYSHAIETLSPERASQLHVLPFGEIERRVEAGVYGTVETCEPGYVEPLGLAKLYRRHAEVGTCAVYWERTSP